MGSLLCADSIAKANAPCRHRYARERRWQFQIFAESWTKLPLRPQAEENSCGGARDVLCSARRTTEDLHDERSNGDEFFFLHSRADHSFSDGPTGSIS
jgi:hypothetical protein